MHTHRILDAGQTRRAKEGDADGTKPNQRHGTIAKSTSDGIMATFAGAAEAVGAAVAIQQAIEKHKRRTAGAPLAVRIGISLGDVRGRGS